MWLTIIPGRAEWADESWEVRLAAVEESREGDWSRGTGEAVCRFCISSQILL